MGDLKFKRQCGAWYTSRLRNTEVLYPDNTVRRLTEQHFAMRIQQKRNQNPQNGMYKQTAQTFINKVEI